MKLITIFNTVHILLIIVILSAGTYHVHQKAALPLKFIANANSLEITQTTNHQNELTISTLLTVENTFVRNTDEIEFLMDSKNIGDTVEVVLINEQVELIESKVVLVPFYDIQYIIIQLISGLSFLLIGWFVYLKKSDLLEAKLFYVLMILTSVIILLTWGKYNIHPVEISYARRILFSFAYVFAPVSFLYFTLSYPYPITRRNNLILFILSSTAFVLFTILGITFIRAASTKNIEDIRSYLLAFDSARFFLSFCIVASIGAFVYSYKNLKEEFHRRKLRWLLLGFVIGPLSFVVFWVIPQALTGYGLIKEEYILLLMVAVPVTFGISIMKYHIMDIDKVINRGTVYSIISVVLFIVYISAIALTTALVGSLTAVSTIWVSIFLSIIVALSFQSIKNITQKVVDKLFFRKRYEFRIVATHFNEKVLEEFLPDNILKYFIYELNTIMPMEKSAILLLDNKTHDVIYSANENYILSNREINKLRNMNPNRVVKYFGNSEWIEGGQNMNELPEELADDKSIVLAFPLSLESDSKLIAIFGKKKSGFKFSYEDVDLIQTMLLLVKTSIEQFQLRQKIFYDLQEIEKLKELNELKSYFVSRVSHELQTPLTSIKIFAELLSHEGITLNEKYRKFTGLIGGECDRLSALINNILNFAKIENGVYEFQKEKVDLNKIVEESFLKIQYQLDIHSFECNIEYSPTPLIINADADAILEIFFNLFSNSIKYSGERKTISIKNILQDSTAIVEFEDEGKGITAEDINKIFSPFERGTSEKKRNAQGIGLGLAIVKHIIDNHEGEIFVQSEIDAGSKFTILFPLVN